MSQCRDLRCRAMWRGANVCRLACVDVTADSTCLILAKLAVVDFNVKISNNIWVCYVKYLLDYGVFTTPNPHRDGAGS